MVLGSGFQTRTLPTEHRTDRTNCGNAKLLLASSRANRKYRSKLKTTEGLREKLRNSTSLAGVGSEVESMLADEVSDGA
jgi:hypothetical protein